MTTHHVQVLEDGRRRYSNGYVYTPVAEKDRKKGRRKPDDPRAVRHNGEWFIPTDLLEDNQRKMPQTLPDLDAYDRRVRGY